MTKIIAFLYTYHFDIITDSRNVKLGIDSSVNHTNFSQEFLDFRLDAIEKQGIINLTAIAIKLTVYHKSEYTPHISADI